MVFWNLVNSVVIFLLRPRKNSEITLITRSEKLFLTPCRCHPVSHCTPLSGLYRTSSSALSDLRKIDFELRQVLRVTLESMYSHKDSKIAQEHMYYHIYIYSLHVFL